jgi:hypothetical protein
VTVVEAHIFQWETAQSRILSNPDRYAVLRDMKCPRPAVLLGLLTLFCAGLSYAPKRLAGESPQDKESKLIKPEIIQGCYELGTLNWRPDLKLGEDAEFITPPRRIQISAEHGGKGFEQDSYLVQPAPGVPRSIHRASYWVPKGANAIEVVWTTGFSGLSMNLNLEGETLRGKATTFWDFPRRKQTAEVVAPKVDCGKDQ